MSVYAAVSITGTTGAMVSIDGTALVDLDICLTLDGSILRVYQLDEDSGAAVSSPTIISPTANAGAKRWLQKSITALPTQAYADHLDEYTAAHGVVIDGVTLKDGGALIITGGTNTFNLTNGTASIDVAAACTVNIDAAVTVAAELHVEAATHVNQDLTTDASPTFTGLTLSGLDSPIGATTARKLRSLIDEEVVATSGALSANQCSGGLINNYAQADNVTLTLPAAAEGYNFTVLLGTTVAKYYRLDPDVGDTIYLDGVSGGDGKYIGIASAVIGAAIQFLSFQTGASAYDWYAATISGTWVSE
jgi:hypothetical protein